MNVLDVFYNQNGIGDVLIVPLEDGDRYDITHENFGDITKITDGQGMIAGYNIFKASTYFDLIENGKISMTENMLEQMKKAFSSNNLVDPLDFDLSPKFIVGHVREKSPHENADRKSVV